MGGPKKITIERDTDLLTKSELDEHWRDVLEAMLAELEQWQQFGGFSRKWRKQARNIIDVRWVFKWKKIKLNGKVVRIIRARLTVRGFKDHGGDDQGTFAGTVSRTSQRIVV